MFDELDPAALTHEELVKLHDLAVADPDVFRYIVHERPDIWRELTVIARERQRAKYGKWYPLFRVGHAAIIWPLRIITAPFKGYV